MIAQTIAVEQPSAIAITDTRVIDFTPAAIRAAVESVGITILRLPAGTRIRTVVFHPESKCISLECGSGGAQRVVSEGELAALLIAYCIAAKIPMPMKAEKRLRVTPTGIAFGFVTLRRLPPWIIPTR